MSELVAITRALQDASEALLEAALDALNRTSSPTEARDLAERALESACSEQGSMQYGTRMMIAGAAAARAASLTEPVTDPMSDDELLSALDDLQSVINLDQLEPSRALDAFGPLGAELAAIERRPFLDFEVDADADDSVLFWAGGAIALNRRSPAT